MERQKNRVFVRNLDPSTSDNDFVSYFQTNYGGVVEGAKIIRDRNGRSKGYGFVSFIDRSIVNKVVSERNHLIGGKKVVCKIASPNTKIQNTSKNNETPQHLREIYVGNLDTDFTLRQLRDYFSYFGAIQNAYIVSDDKETSLGFGFVEFENSSSIDTVQELRPHNINDREIQTLRVYPKNVPTYLKKPTNVLYVTNYDYVDEDDIEQYFSQFGDIILLSCKIRRPQDVKFMEIQFEDYDSVDVICLADNHTINGCTISVSKYLPNHFDKVQNSQTGVQNQNYYSSGPTSANSHLTATADNHWFTSNPHPVITQQPSNSFFETRTAPTIQGHESHFSQNYPQSNEEDNGCCGGSNQHEPETDENQDCIIL